MAAPKAPVLDASGKKSKDLALEEAVFAAELKPHLVHETVRAEQNAARAGTRGAKSRGMVAGESVTVETFQPGDKVKVAGISIGKGFAGTIMRHNFHRGPVTHGSHNVRKPGSVGASATPSRVFKGVRMAGRLGGKRVTQVGLTVHATDLERNLLLVKGAVPGPKNGLVEIREETR